MATDEEDPLRDLDYDLARDEVAMVNELFAAVFKHLGPLGERTEDEMRAEIEQLLIDDPATRELVERLGLRLRFRALPPNE